MEGFKTNTSTGSTEKKKDCTGCTWYAQCNQASRCEMYDPLVESELNYMWTEMEYNQKLIDCGEIKKESIHDIYEEGDMQEWFKLNSTFL